MTKGIRIALVTAAMAGGIALAGASPASAQVRFRSSFPVPHGRIAVRVGAPFFRVGALVPYGYTVIEDPEYGYGFYYQSRWIPVERYGSSWIVGDRPFFGGRGFNAPRGSFRAYGGGGGERFDRGRGDRFDRGRFDSRRDARFERRDFRQDRRRDFRQDHSRRGDRDDRRGGRGRDRDGRR